MCDVRVVTAMSTFGYVAAGLAAPPPPDAAARGRTGGGGGGAVVVVGYEGTCGRDVTGEPCLHSWPVLLAAPCFDRDAMLSPQVRGTRAPCRFRDTW